MKISLKQKIACIGAGIAILSGFCAVARAQSVVPEGSGAIASSIPASQDADDGYYAPTPGQMEEFYPTLNVASSLKSSAIPTNKWWTYLATAFADDGNDVWTQTSPYGCDLWMYPGMVVPQTYGMDLHFPDSWNTGTIPQGGFNAGPALSVAGSTTSGAFAASGYPTVTAYGDWSMEYTEKNSAGNVVDTTLARGVPFVWCKYTGVQPIIEVAPGVTLYDINGNAINTSSGSFVETQFCFTVNGTTYGVFAPTNTTFNVVSTGVQAMISSPSFLVYGFLPATSNLSLFSTYAYAQPTNTQLGWTYDPVHGFVDTTWTITATALQGSNTATLQGWLPHHYRTTTNNLTFEPFTYLTPRGTLQISAGSAFTIDFPFKGISPMLPAPHVNGVSSDYNPSRMQYYMNYFAPYHPGVIGDTYGGGKDLAMSAQYMTMADQMELPASRNELLSTIETRIDDWYTYTAGKANNFFARYPDWGATIGYPPSYGTQGFNDNHFHYGYWLVTSALTGMEDPTWLNNYSPMITQVLKEYANWDRTDTTYPFFRTFDIWQGHSWAGGTSSPGGENQESSSEAMDSWTGMFLYGSITNNSAIQAAGAMGYAMESSAVNEYWQDWTQTNFPATYGEHMCGILGDNSLAYATYFDGDPAWIYGIQMVPSWYWNQYLARNPTFSAAQINDMWNERTAASIAGINGFSMPDNNTPAGLGSYLGDYILGYQMLFDQNDVATMLDEYYAAGDAMANDETYSGEIYYQTHALRALGDQAQAYTTSIPTGMVFQNATSGVLTAVVYNTQSTAQTCTVYDNGTAVMSESVPANQFAEFVVAANNVAPTAPADLTPLSGNAQMSLTWAPGSGATSYNVYRGTASGGESGTPLASGITRCSYLDSTAANGVTYYYTVASVNSVGNSAASNQVSGTPSAPVESPWGGTPWPVPGVVQSENYDLGGNGIGYGSPVYYNQGGFYRTGDGVGIENTGDVSGGYDVGWTGPGQWLNYTINVETAGVYTVGLRVADPATGNTIDIRTPSGTAISGTLTVPNTGGYQVWTTMTANITLPAGVQTIQVYQDTGGYNLNYMTFTYTGTGLPAAPSTPTATNSSGTDSLTWTAVGGATSYNIFRSTMSGLEAAVPIATASGVTYTDAGLTNNQTYYYVVTANNASGWSYPSGELTTTPPSGALQLPAAPTLTASPALTNQNFLTWTPTIGPSYNPVGAVGYAIYRGTASGAELTTAVNTISNDTYTDTGLTNGTTYFYKVAAINEVGTSPLSNEVSSTPSTTASIPQAPSNLTATPGNTLNLLAWSFVGGAATYNVYRSTASSGEGTTPLATGLIGEGYIDSGLTNGTTYYYRVAAVNSAGTSAQSSQASAAPTVGTVTIPLTPTGLAATAGSAQVALGWGASTGATSYNLYRSTASGGEGATAYKTGIASPSYTDTGLTNGTTYFYKVAAVNTAGTSGQSTEVSATPTAGVPPAPTGLGATPGNAQVALSWTASTGATSYNVYRGTASGGESAASVATGITTTSYTNTGLTNGTPYYYKVAALDASGTSAQSNEASATPSAGTGAMVLGINCGGSATGSWVADEDFSGGTANTVTNTINTANVTNPAPTAVYQTNRFGTCSYAVTGLTASTSYTVRLHFCETY
ncbi:MAG: glycosyl hydrolase, partial [Capsulimonadaceae bacterium]